MPRLALPWLVGCAVALAAGAGPAWAAPANDDFLAAAGASGQDARDTADATVQADLFGPGGVGGGPEPTRCGSTGFGKTVWYRFSPDRRGVLEVRTAGFDSVVAVYALTAAGQRLGEALDCADTPGGGEDLFVPVQARGAYAVQIGGADRGGGPAGGLLQATFDLYGDADGDGLFDELDTCPRRPGVRGAAGCPPSLDVDPRIRWALSGSTMRVLSLRTGRLPAGAAVELRCTRGCSALERVRVGARARAVSLGALRGLALRAGARFELRVTHAPTGSGLYEHGAIGSYYGYEVTQSAIRRTDRCLLPGSRTPRRSCR